MEKLSPGDILHEVHEAAKDLQMMIDQKSYLLVNAEGWESERRPKKIEDPDSFQELKENENEELVINSHSETTMNQRSFQTLKNLDPQNPNMSINLSVPQWGSSEDMLKQPISWPSRLSVLAMLTSQLSVLGDAVLNERKLRTYESASALSLATLTSLLIEFVARGQNLVNSFEVLGEKAKFKEPK